jgi:long-chain acyl-CoA synthetase
VKKLLPLTQFLAQVEETPHQDYLHQPLDGHMRVLTWLDVDTQAKAIAGALVEMGITKGERIGILSKNCAEWFIADIAIMMAGLVSVPIYHTANRETIDYIVGNSDCKAVFVGRLDSLSEAENGLSSNIPRIIFPYPSVEGNYQWGRVLEGKPLESIYQANKEDTMSIVYTSGSTGKPKGVVLSYLNFAAAADAATDILPDVVEQRLMSYLPLAHITERSLIEMLSFYVGCKIYFVDRLDTFISDVTFADPTVFLSVPRLWNKFQSEILSKIPDNKLQLLLKVPFLGKILAKKIRTGLGLKSTLRFGSGTAPISPSILRWYQRLGVSISEGWGMTEATGLSCSNQPFSTESLGSIGKPLSCVEMKIGGNKEIMIRGDAVFSGYFKNSKATQESFTDGWFHTGDMGEISKNGDYKIIGRVKEQFKTAKGKYVAPAPIENYLGQNTDIEQVCIIGEGRKQPIALVVLNPQNKESSELLQNSLSKTLHIVNKKLEKHQKLDHIIVLKEEWSVENNLLTPTLKIKRADIEKRFEHFIEMEIEEKIYWDKN